MLRADRIVFTNSDNDIYTIEGKQLEAFPIIGGEEAEQITSKVWNQHGNTFINAFMEPYEGEIIFVIHTANKSEANIGADRLKISNFFNPLAGVITMEIKLNNGSSYKRDITLISAPVFPVGFENRNNEWFKIQLLYAANDPFWYSENEIIESFQTAEPLFTFPFSFETTVIAKPSKPIVKVTELTNAVKLEWVSTEHTTVYKIYRSQNKDSLGSKLTELNSYETSYTDNTAIGSETYYYTVKAVLITNEIETGVNSDKMLAVPTLAKPSKPILAVTDFQNSCKLTWQPTTNTTSYKLFRTTNKDTLGSQLIEIKDVNTITYSDDTAIGDTQYYYTVKAINLNENTGIDAATSSDKIAGKPFTFLVYSNRTVDFSNYAAWTVYGATQVTADFGNEHSVKENDRIKIDTAGKLRWFLPAGTIGTADSGGLIRAKIAAKHDLTFEYDVKFDEGFPWSKGGKIAGISGGKGYTGGKDTSAGDGWSARIMWREGGRLIPYVYHYGQTSEYGDTFGKTLGYVTAGATHHIKYYVALNTASNKDGILKIYLDEKLVLDKNDIVFRTDDSKIDTIHLSFFAGGSTTDWNMTADGYIRLDNVSWK